MDTANELVNIIRDLVKEEVKKTDCSEFCTIQSVNSDGTLNIQLFSDVNTIIPDIINCSSYNFNKGDTAILYKMGNNLNNAFIIAKPTNIFPDRISELNQIINHYNNSIPRIGRHYIQFSGELEPAEIYPNTEWEVDIDYLDKFLFNGTVDEIGESDGSNDAIVVSHKHTFQNGQNGKYVVSSSSRGEWDSNYIYLDSPGYYRGNSDYADNFAVKLSDIITETGYSGVNKNIPKYKRVVIWKRTA